MDEPTPTGRILVIGYGSTLRGDDGIGPRAAELLADDPRLAGAAVLARHQLTPELAADIAEADLVVLVDASETEPPGRIAVRRLAGGSAAAEAAVGGAGGTWTHHVDAESLLALARELWGAAPAVYLVAIGAESMELGDGLSEAVELALPEVIETVVRIAAEHGAGGRGATG
jgi:hydrogenase maturation protease